MAPKQKRQVAFNFYLFLAERTRGVIGWSISFGENLFLIVFSFPSSFFFSFPSLSLDYHDSLWLLIESLADGEIRYVFCFHFGRRGEEQEIVQRG